jgi:hypothetical protein
MGHPGHVGQEDISGGLILANCFPPILDNSTPRACVGRKESEGLAE